VKPTTRISVDSHSPLFQREDDLMEWGASIKNTRLDLRAIPSVEIFCNYIERNMTALDILINNAGPDGTKARWILPIILMSNEESLLLYFLQTLQKVLSDHTSLFTGIQELTSVHLPSKMPVTWHGPESGNWK